MILAQISCKDSSPNILTTYWTLHIDGETMETVKDFILGGSKITADVIEVMKLKDAYSLEGKL